MNNPPEGNGSKGGRVLLKFIVCFEKSIVPMNVWTLSVTECSKLNIVS